MLESEFTPARLTLTVAQGVHAGLSFSCTEHTLVLVGRGKGLQLSLPGDSYLSRLHFAIEFNPPLCQLTDRGSTGGTALNGIRLTQPTPLQDGDHIQAGRSTFAVHLELPGPLDATLPWNRLRQPVASADL